MKFGLQINRFDWAGAPDSIGSKLAEIAWSRADGLDWVVPMHYRPLG
jgi:hypothetical protein